MVISIYDSMTKVYTYIKYSPPLYVSICDTIADTILFNLTDTGKGAPRLGQYRVWLLLVLKGSVAE